MPVSWINLSDFKDGFTPHEACGILFIIIAVLVMLCMMLVKKGKIQVYK